MYLSMNCYFREIPLGKICLAQSMQHHCLVKIKRVLSTKQLKRGEHNFSIATPFTIFSLITPFGIFKFFLLTSKTLILFETDANRLGGLNWSLRLKLASFHFDHC